MTDNQVDLYANPQASKLQRVRDNQRRCRTRKKEYITSLEARLRDLEQKGAQASVELQQQARRVLAENRLLRGLLTERFHMSAEGIDAYLLVGRDGQQDCGSEPSVSGSRQVYAPPATAAIPVASSSTNRSTCSMRQGTDPLSSCGTTLSRDASSHSSSIDVLGRDVQQGCAGLPSACGSGQVYASSTPTAMSATFNAPESTRCPRQVTTEPPVLFDPTLDASADSSADVQTSPQAEDAITLNNIAVLPYDVALLALEHIPQQPMVGQPLANVVSDETMAVMCSTPWPLPPSNDITKSYTSCTFAYQLLKAINQRRFIPMNMNDVIVEWLWYGFRTSDDSTARCCVVDDTVLYSVAVNLLQ